MLLLFFTLGALNAQDYALTWTTIDGGGGSSTDGFFELSATVGQPEAGFSSDMSGFYQLESGFWGATVPTRPFFISLPGDTNVDFGVRVDFEAGVVGTPPFRYQWRLNGVNLVGQTNSSITITNAGLTNAGTYSVVVANAFGVADSGPLSLTLKLPLGMKENDFDNRVSLELTDMRFTADNLGATREAGEPNHAGKLGGASVWYTWSTNANGIATFHTRGSGFDTILAVYTNDTLATLGPVAGDDDRGGFLASEVQFNVTAGTQYQIVVDGLGARTGTFVLSREFELTNEKLPVITVAPASQAATFGGQTTFSVTATGSGLTYQWFFNGSPIVDANQPSLDVENVQIGDVGYYTVRITNIFLRWIESLPAALEIGSIPSVVSYPKVEDLRLANGFTWPLASSPRPRSAPAFSGTGGGTPGLGSFPVSAGTIGTQIYGNTNAPRSDPCNRCTGIGEKAQWYGLSNAYTGLLTIDTIGSTFDTIMAVYVDTPNELYFCQSTNFIGCDDDSADGVHSLVTFLATAGTRYLIGVDGTGGGGTNLIQLNWRHCLPPAPFQLAPNRIQLVTEPNPSPYPENTNYYWMRDGESYDVTGEPFVFLREIPSADQVFSVAYAVTNNGAIYWVTNAIGNLVTTESNLIHEEQGATFQIVLPRIAGTEFQLEVADPSGTNCTGGWLWLPVSDVNVITQGMTLLLEVPVEARERFFRIRPPP